MYGTSLKKYEKKALVKFMLIYMISSFLLFAALAIMYFFEQKHIILRELQDEMTAYISLSRDGNEIEKFEDFSIDVEPARRHQYPRFYEEKERFVSVSCASKYYPDQVFVVSADKSILKDKTKKLVLKITLMMSGAFFVFLGLSYYLARISIRPIVQASKMIDTVIEDILHDLNAPMTAIAINCEILNSDLSDAKYIKKVERIEKSNKTIRFLYNNLQLLLDKPIGIKNESIDAVSILKDRIEFFKEIYPESSFEGSYEPLIFTADSAAFERIIDNLLSNAIKYSQSTPKIKVTVKNREIEIEDNGIGIKDCAKIFERNYREIQVSHCKSGLGLGLSIIKKLCAELKIEIGLTTTVGKGSRFVLKIKD